MREILLGLIVVMVISLAINMLLFDRHAPEFWGRYIFIVVVGFVTFIISRIGENIQ